jgi:catechol 2,3-dioxygenase-like lactoylglutathione lyase family enzyme
MKYLHTMVRVTDLEASLRFYRDALALEVIKQRDYPKASSPWSTWLPQATPRPRSSSPTTGPLRPTPAGAISGMWPMKWPTSTPPASA